MYNHSNFLFISIVVIRVIYEKIIFSNIINSKLLGLPCNLSANVNCKLINYEHTIDFYRRFTNYFMHLNLNNCQRVLYCVCFNASYYFAYLIHYSKSAHKLISLKACVEK